ncbi:hypothetical protein LKMONMHP_0680 [Methylobacterium organophilum]|uniref:Uncharacterized protein n=1 Tax=Methylobacterium organophilum TaxID=410 RepID=A0ABQ4T6X0_METOR|nr:hypothetical protein LKMONMHP_0680 [Methylobacterium organophilum]
MYSPQNIDRNVRRHDAIAIVIAALLATESVVLLWVALRL